MQSRSYQSVWRCRTAAVVERGPGVGVCSWTGAWPRFEGESRLPLWQNLASQQWITVALPYIKELDLITQKRSGLRSTRSEAATETRRSSPSQMERGQEDRGRMSFGDPSSTRAEHVSLTASDQILLRPELMGHGGVEAGASMLVKGNFVTMLNPHVGILL